MRRSRLLGAPDLAHRSFTEPAPLGRRSFSPTGPLRSQTSLRRLVNAPLHKHTTSELRRGKDGQQATEVLLPQIGGSSRADVPSSR